MEETAHNILGEIQDPIDMDMVMEKYPVKYEQSMNTVLIQEVIRYSIFVTQELMLWGIVAEWLGFRTLNQRARVRIPAKARRGTMYL
jgi:hypothetical protein